MDKVQGQVLFEDICNIVAASKQNGVFLVRELSNALVALGYHKDDCAAELMDAVIECNLSQGNAYRDVLPKGGL